VVVTGAAKGLIGGHCLLGADQTQGW